MGHAEQQARNQNVFDGARIWGNQGTSSALGRGQSGNQQIAWADKSVSVGVENGGQESLDD